MSTELKIGQIKEILDNTPAEELPAELDKFKDDTRQGVIKLLEKYKKSYDAYIKEVERTENMKMYEKKYSDYEYIAGIDEVGRGPLAGPVVTCAVILPKDFNVLYINDSKKLSEKKREELYDIIMKEAIAVGIGIESPKVIDEINILQATYSAMRKAIEDYKMIEEGEIK